MKYSINKFQSSLLYIALYELLMIFFKPSGLSFGKIVITLLVWISFYITLSNFVTKFHLIKSKIPTNAFILFIIMLLWNIINIIRSVYTNNVTSTTLWGNNYTALSLLVPFALSFSTNISNLNNLNNYFKFTIIIGFVLFPLFLLQPKESTDFIFNNSLMILFIGIGFLITTIHFQPSKNILWIISGSIMLLALGINIESRTMIGRIVLLYLALILLSYIKRHKERWLLKLVYGSLFLPLLFIYISLNTGQSAISKLLENTENPNYSSDTRSFLYTEVITDLIEYDKLICGKGASGTYYSPYFNNTKDDTDTRLTVEVGILAILLKGGLISVFLNIALLFIAIHYSFFRSNNFFSIGIGFILLIHTILLFIENLVAYNLYNILIWFYVGISLSKEVRILNNNEIKNIIQYGKYTS